MILVTTDVWMMRSSFWAGCSGRPDPCCYTRWPFVFRELGLHRRSTYGRLSKRCSLVLILVALVTLVGDMQSLQKQSRTVPWPWSMDVHN